MEENDLRDLESIFAQVEDPRIERTKLHRLRDIIILAICGIIYEAEGWVDIEEFGEVQIGVLAFPEGVTIRCVQVIQR